jgi:HNH endonuclease
MRGYRKPATSVLSLVEARPAYGRRYRTPIGAGRPRVRTSQMTSPRDLIPGLTSRTYEVLEKLGITTEERLERLAIGDVIDAGVGWSQVHRIITYLIESGYEPELRGPGPEWDEDRWRELVQSIVDQGIVSWQEVAVATLGELNPPQVGTSLASNANIKAQYPRREAMRNVLAWFYERDGRCQNCGRRIHIEVDHIKSKDEFVKAGLDRSEADRLDNFQLLCKRCNVIKRPSHRLGGLTFATAQAALMWILLVERPRTYAEFELHCRAHGMTMANIRFREAWAMAEWLANAGLYEIDADA